LNEGDELRSYAASNKASTSSAALSGVYPAGLRITAFPPAKDDAILCATVLSGELNDIMAQTIPSGTRMVNPMRLCWPGLPADRDHASDVLSLTSGSKPMTMVVFWQTTAYSTSRPDQPFTSGNSKLRRRTTFLRNTGATVRMNPERKRARPSHINPPYHDIRTGGSPHHHKMKQVSLDRQDNIFPGHIRQLTTKALRYIRICEIVPNG